MGEMYDRIDALCKAKKITVTKMCRDSKVSQGSVSDLKTGRTGELSLKSLSKIAQYFDISLDYFRGDHLTSYRLWTEWRLREAEAQYELESDRESREALAAEIEMLREALEDQKLAGAITGMEKHQPSTDITDEQLMFALWGNIDDVTPEDLAKVREYAAFIRSRRKEVFTTERYKFSTKRDPPKAIGGSF